MNIHTLPTLRPFPTRQFPASTSFPRRTIIVSSLNSRRFNSICRIRDRNFQVILCSIHGDGKVLEPEDAALLAATCITRNLPPALTLEHGLDKIKEAVEGLKLKPPNCERGMLRFQVLVPPTAAALNWFCCQHESLEIFPQFFLSKEIENPTCKFLSLNRTYGVFGIGAAFISKECPHSSANYSASQRYLPVDSTRVMAYGFSDINFDATLPYMKHLFIPQIELDEYEGLSILAATLAWSDSCLCTFEQAAQNLDSTLYQVRHHSLPHIEGFCKTFFSSARMKFSMVEDKNLQMVCMSALSLGGSNLSGDPVELIDVSCFHQFCIRLSPTSAIANYMLDHAGGTSHSLKGYANINALWASLIIEECSRLGLTYFCVAPGSRSSPLAIAASAHPLATCIACFDERSLAFHAIGYGRGSRKPAVVITSSGTAVSNLLPAVVEASQDCVPLMLLTADRPPELQDAGANQAINQVNHFGSFVRYFFNLPPPADDVSARMVLTTVDSAFYMAISTPHGPVHINCPFREPLENSPKKWMVSCLKGLNFWISSGGPFTRYVNIQHSFASNTCCHMAEVLKVIQGASQGLLLIGAMHTEEDIWAALLLAKHLSWPMVADILSGLRLRKYLTHFPAMEENFLFIDHLDHLLLSNSVRDWMQADVIVQIGSRITSKRISQMLEDSIPCTYIMVDKHPSRHDPSHLVTHRIQSTITEFTDCLLNVCKPNLSSNWRGFLKTLNMMAAWEISFLIHSEALLTEPYIAHLIPEALVDESAVFVGNSMPIRDADMYACNWGKCTHTNTMMLSSGLPFHSIQVAGNRGASGIDGLLSTAVGFAVGCNKRVLCLIGDISFLHDTNGLALLEQRRWRKPMTIIVINNHGGAIFSLLPIAERTEQSVLDQYFYTSHNISIHHLCVAHGVKHVPVRTKLEFQNALISSQEDDIDSVLEVESCIDANTSIHSLRKFTSQAADHASSILSKISVSDSSMHSFIICKICKMGYSLYRIQLYSPPTSASVSYDLGTFYREGFLIALSLDDGSSGFGEVAPLDIHKENMVDVEEQLRFLIHVIEGAKIDYYLPLLKDSFSSWIWNSLGISPSSIFPSVRCGLEMAVLNAMAAREGSTLLNILHPWLNNDDEISGRSLNVQINALIDSAGTPTDVAFLAAQLVKEGFSAIKLKVARRADPLEDATVIQEVRKAVGNCIELRVDANRNWTYDEAFRFGSSVKNCNLQYIEEPVRDEYDIIKFCEETGIPVALDETINSLKENPLEVLSQFAHPGVVAIVIKPSIVGGFEKAAMVARWAHQKGKMAVLSSAFESGLGLSAYIQFCSYLALQNADLCRVMNKEPALPIAHGLGTYSWLKEDVTTNSLPIGPNPHTGFMEASVLDAGQLLQNFPINHDVIIRKFTGETVRNYSVSVVLGRLSFTVNLQEVGPSNDKNLLVFLHGFLGSGEDWIPIMKAISGSSRCIAVDLPGHGGSKQQYQETDEKVEEPNLSIELVANILNQLFHRLTPEKVTLVGYSMGARIALYMALKCSNKVEGAVIISGSPGLKDAEARKFRIAKDDFLASFLISNGLELFLDTWYAGEMWNSLRDHPRFKQILSNRLQHADVLTLAKVLSDLSTGRQPSLWEELKNCKLPILLIFGEKDRKFKRISQKMYDEISHEPEGRDRSSMVEIPNSGHAVHLENPLPVINAVRKYLTSSQKEFHLITEDAIRR